MTKTKPDTVSSLTAKLATARVGGLTATAAVDAADAAYRTGLLSEPPATVQRLIDTRTEATIALDRAAAVIADLEARIVAAEVDEAEGARNARYAAAVKLAATASEELARYPAAAEAIRTVLGAIAEADIAIAAANQDLPAGKAPIISPEAVRSLPNLPDEVLSEETVELWAHVGDSMPLPDDRQGQVDRLSRLDGKWDCARRSYVRRTMLPAVFGRHVRALSSEIRLPGAFGESPFWEPVHSPADALRQLSKHRQPPAVDGTREPVTAFVRVGPV